MFDYLIVGAGFAGSVLAERLARGSNKKVLLCDKRPHIGGNAYDHYNEDGILVHKYGPHIFHTNSREVFEYLSRFTEWRPYQHRVRASVDGQIVPIPINLDTINTLYGLNLTSFEVADFLKELPSRANRFALRKMSSSTASVASSTKSFSSTTRGNSGGSIPLSSTLVLRRAYRPARTAMIVTSRTLIRQCR
jgi:UDP-galactopyranose mutase